MWLWFPQLAIYTRLSDCLEETVQKSDVRFTPHRLNLRPQCVVRFQSAIQ